MFREAILLLVTLVASTVAGVTEVRHIEADGSHLVDTLSQNFGLTSYNLQSLGWKTVSVNGNSVVIYNANCQASTRTLDSLNQQEVAQLKLAKGQLESIENPGGQMNQYSRYAVTRIMGTNMNRSARNLASSSNIINGLSILKQDDNNYSITKPQMPNNLARFYMMNDVVTFVYLDGQVQMKPIACLNASEQQQVAQIKSEMVAAEQSMRLMQQQMQQQMQQNMQQNMQQMRQNMQQNMQQMQQNMQQNMLQLQRNGMQNMFGNGIQNRQQQMANNYGYNSGQSYGNPAAPYASNGGAYAGNYMAPPNFGNNWPFGPNNNPFGPGFPFNG